MGRTITQALKKIKLASTVDIYIVTVSPQGHCQCSLIQPKKAHLAREATAQRSMDTVYIDDGPCR